MRHPYLPRPPDPAAQVLAVLPFGIVSALVFSFSIYGMAGLRHSGVALARHGLLTTLAYLIASQVGAECAWRSMFAERILGLQPGKARSSMSLAAGAWSVRAATGAYGLVRSQLLPANLRLRNIPSNSYGVDGAK